MTVSVELVTLDPRPTAVVARTTTWEEFPHVWRELLDEVYGFVRGRRELATGDGSEQWQNVMLYKDDRPDVEVGVLAAKRFESVGPVISSTLPGGEAATAVHRGDYAKLGATHDAVRAHAAACGRELETEVFWLLR
jgi:effector-binding domain-containing protein